MDRQIREGISKRCTPVATLARARESSEFLHRLATVAMVPRCGLNMRLASATFAMLCVAMTVGQLRGQSDRAVETARQTMELSGLHGGLAVHYDCGDGGLIVALGGDDAWVVQGLSRDEEQVEQCRRAIESHMCLPPKPVYRFSRPKFCIRCILVFCAF